MEEEVGKSRATLRACLSRYYNKRIKNDPDFYEAEKQRVQEYIVNRCKTDEEFRKKRSQNSLKSYYKKKELLKAQKVQEVN